MIVLKEVIGRGRGNESYERWFYKIAEELIFHCHVLTSEATYRIREIEFYYHDESHEDLTVYGIINKQHKLNSRIFRHKKRQYNQFTWFIHYSGIDIVFGDANNPAGILIRAIERIGENGEPDEMITGPLVVLLELTNQSTKVFDSSPFTLQLIEAQDTVKKLERGQRVGISDKRMYNFKYNNGNESTD